MHCRWDRVNARDVENHKLSSLCKLPTPGKNLAEWSPGLSKSEVKEDSGPGKIGQLPHLSV